MRWTYAYNSARPPNVSSHVLRQQILSDRKARDIYDQSRPCFCFLGTQPLMQDERGSHSCRERNDGLYLCITYLCAKLTEEILLAIVFSLVFSCLVFFPVQFLGQWVFFWLIYLTTTCIGISAPLFWCPDLTAACRCNIYGHEPCGHGMRSDCYGPQTSCELVGHRVCRRSLRSSCLVASPCRSV